MTGFSEASIFNGNSELNLGGDELEGAVRPNVKFEQNFDDLYTKIEDGEGITYPCE